MQLKHHRPRADTHTFPSSCQRAVHCATSLSRAEDRTQVAAATAWVLGRNVSSPYSQLLAAACLAVPCHYQQETARCCCCCSTAVAPPARCSLTRSCRNSGFAAVLCCCCAVPPLACHQQPLPVPKVGGVAQGQHALCGCKALNAGAAVRSSLRQQQQQQTQQVRVGKMWPPPRY
jgi:hypothetical protein